MDEFETQANTLAEMSEQVASYEKSGKQEAASRLKEQMQLLEVIYMHSFPIHLQMFVFVHHYMSNYLILLQKRFKEVQERFKQFQSSSSDIEPRLTRVLRELRGVEEATCLLDIASDDLEGIEGQLKHCMVWIMCD